MTAPQLRPVYLAVPSSGECGLTEDISRAIADFVDGLAVHPAAAERVLLGVVEYTTFLNELCPLGTRLEDAARATVSGFDGISYASLFDDLAQLLTYDRCRLIVDGEQLGQPVVVIIVESVPQPDDHWRDGHRVLTDLDADLGHGAPVIVAISTGPAAADLAEAIASPSHPQREANSPVPVGQSAARVVIRACLMRGIGVNDEPTEGFPKKGTNQ